MHTSRISLITSKETQKDFWPFLQNLSLNRYHALKELYENEKENPITEVIFIESKILKRGFEKEYKKLSTAPSLIILPEKIKKSSIISIQNIWTYFLTKEMSPKEISQLVQIAATAARKRRRISALREHQSKTSFNQKNPILQLITKLTNACTSAEDYPDLLKAVLTMKESIGFQDASIIFTNNKNDLTALYHAPHEGKIYPFDFQSKIRPSLSLLLKNSPSKIVSTSDEEAKALNEFTKHPWSSCLKLQLSHSNRTKRKETESLAYIFLFRRELVSFTEKELWLLELASGPLLLAFEKVSMLKKIDLASKEWRSTFDGISEPITVIDREFNIVKANKAFANLIEADVKKIKNKKCFSLLANRRSPCVECPAVKENQALRIKGKNKNDLLAWSYSIKLDNNDFRFQFYRNVSKETALTAALVQSEKMAALGKLVGAIAHEINNPLAGILATSQLLLNDSSNTIPQEISNDIMEISAAALRSKKIIDDLLGFTVNQENIKELVDIQDCILTSITFSRSALKNIKLNLNIDNNLPKTLISSSSIQQVLFNLITNASHAMREKGELTISAHYVEHDNTIAIRVFDNGPGIQAETLRHIFDPFYTSKLEGKGTGLGLSIVKNLITKIGGTITATSTPGKGSSFNIHIPVLNLN